MKFMKSPPKQAADTKMADLAIRVWHSHFAWLPVETEFSYLWLQVVERRWNDDLNEVPDGHFSVLLGDWEYREAA